jgi:hypothetical protein
MLNVKGFNFAPARQYDMMLDGKSHSPKSVQVVNGTALGIILEV